MKSLLVLPVLVVLSVSLSAQEVPPALMVEVDGKSQPLGLTKLETQVRIYGQLAETSMTMTFTSSLDRVMEGHLYFPLPEGSTVSGYALDINGNLVDGVAVEKQKGRQVFEKIVRQGIDPGLVEWTKGNNFKTRVYPIPANGARTIRVCYVSELISHGGEPAMYRLPLNFKDAVKEFALSIEVVKPAAVPTVRQGDLANFEFEKWRDSYKAETKLTDVVLGKDLVVALPDVERVNVLVERADDGQTYFAVHDFPQPPSVAERHIEPKHVTIYWDASGSRGASNHDREIEVLKKCLWQLLPDDRKSGGFTVDVVVFRNAAAQSRQFKWQNLNWRPPNGKDALVDYLKNIKYDGGTRLAAISKRKSDASDMYLLFTDGLSNFGKEEPKGIDKPVYVFSADTAADHTALKQLAAKTGGRYFNLNRMKDAAVVEQFNRPAYSFLGATADSARVMDVYPQLPQPLSGQITVAGKLIDETATITLNYGYPGQPPVSKTFAVNAAGAVEGVLLRRLWAQTKLADLLVAEKENESEIVDLGKKHSLVTPFTSLIVLDSLEQYIEHQIPPPRSLPKMLHEYNQRIDTLAAQQEKQKTDKLAAVVAMWKSRVEWWDTEFKYPKDFRYRADDKTKDEAANGDNPSGGEADAERDDAEPMAPRTPAPHPRGDGQDPFGDAPADEVAPAEEAPEATEEPMDDLDSTTGRPHQGDGGDQRSGLVVSATKAKDGGDAGRQPGIAIKAWDPKTPYMKELKAAKDATEAYAIYLKNRAEYGESPAFYLDCADHFAKTDPALGLQVLSNIAELELENPELLRVLGHRLVQQGQYDLAIGVFEDVKEMKPEEPQSYRDLALALIRRADGLRESMQRRRMTAESHAKCQAKLKADYSRALDLLNEVVLGEWDRFEEIEIIALMEANRIIPRAKAIGIEVPIDKRLIKLLECDIRISMTWHADLTDIDLHVIEPSTEEAYYSHNRTTIGGLVSRDFTQGYGPEEYMVRRAMNGMYTIKAKYYGSQSTKLLGDVTIQLDIFTNYGRENEQRQSITRRLQKVDEMIEIGKIEF
jgi:Ca-activated chloride channel family protein